MVGQIVPNEATHLTIYQYGGGRRSGAGAFGARPTVVESAMVDGEIGSSIYGTIHPTISCSKNRPKLTIIPALY